MNQAAVASQLNEWQLIPRPERYTELYFVSHQQLPTSMKAGKTLRLPFTIRNNEHRPTAYHYKLSAQATDTSEQLLLSEGTVKLTHNRSEILNPIITMPVLGKRVALKVTLSYQAIAIGNDAPSWQAQSIHHWVKADYSVGKNKRQL